jgi:hypothetical protein
MTSQKPIWIAFLANGAVAAATYAICGWNSLGAHAGARNTARFAMLWFITGFAAPGLTRYFHTLVSEVRLLQAFLAAQVVHFGTVAAVLASFPAAHMKEHPGRALAVIVIGSSLAFAAGLTPRPGSARVYRVIHTVGLYAVFAIFFLAFAGNRVKPLRALVALPAAALVLRMTGEFKRAESPAANLFS